MNIPGKSNWKSTIGSGLGIILWFAILFALILWIWTVMDGSDSGVRISYTQFLQELQEGNLERIIVTGSKIEGKLKQPRSRGGPEETTQYGEFLTYLPSFAGEGLMNRLQERGVRVETLPEQDLSWWTVVLNLLPLLILILVFSLLLRGSQSQGRGLLGMGKSRAKAYDRTQSPITFDDAAGAHEAKAELEEVISFLRNPGRFHRLGGEIPRGVLLLGPPGTGKTLLARAVAGEADVPFFSITGSDFMEMLVGVGASRVRDLFGVAKQSAPAIIFIDELDSIGRRRGAGLGGGHDEREQTLNQLLSEMDGFEPNHSVVVIAATNRPDILDPALLRPGRFDRRVIVDLPTLHDRQEILVLHARNKPISASVDLARLARATPGFSGADLKNLLNEAALLAARRDKQEIEPEDIEASRDKVLMGLKRENLALTEEECRLLAYHEAGHAVVAAALPNTDAIHKVTIVPRGRAMGVTQQLPDREKYLYSREYLLDRLAVMMGGRAAEELVLSTRTSGAANDLKQATRLARKMVLDWGMSLRFGHIALGSEGDEVFLGEDLAHRREYSDATAHEVDSEVRDLLDEAFQRARGALQEHREGLDRLAEALIREEEISGERVLETLQLSRSRHQPSLEEPVSSS